MLTYAVGDIHGCSTKLASVVRHCVWHAGPRAYRFVFLGDYVDRGPESEEVVNFMIETQSHAPDRVACLKGNHEAMLLDASEGKDIGLWLGNGGEMTLRSYRARSAPEIPIRHLQWFESLPVAISDGKRFFVHAGVVPGVPLPEQPAHALLWMREPFLSDPRDHGCFVVHGHTPVETGRPDLRRNRLNLDTGACFGGPLTAAVFNDTRVGPLAFITDDGDVIEAPAIVAPERV